MHRDSLVNIARPKNSRDRMSIDNNEDFIITRILD